VFVQVQREVHAGRWPAGFAAWLEVNLCAALCSRAVVSDERRWHWYIVLRGNEPRYPGVFGALRLQTMNAGMHDDWGEDLRRLAACIGQEVPHTVRESIRYYVALGD
jgi:hypothetical protein